MPVNLSLPAAAVVPGVSLSTCAAGIKANGSDDMVLFSITPGSTTVGVFTQNTFCAAPVTVCKSHLEEQKQGDIRALLVNSGNANAGTGQPGIEAAKQHCAALAEQLDCDLNQVLPYSTGVIGEQLPNAKMLSALPGLVKNLDDSLPAWEHAARGIMTTDTVPKLTSKTVTIDGQVLTITGMSKGAGMIEPNMATMLAYVFTDAKIPKNDLNEALKISVHKSFNSITVDSDTSTNDACMLTATGVGATLSAEHSQWGDFQNALDEVLLLLAQAIVRDAEGATKFITAEINGGASVEDCRAIGYAIANSPLVKTAMFASDANVGRLLMAIGKVGLAKLDPYQVNVSVNGLAVFENGLLHPDYSEHKGGAVMQADDITVAVDLGMGKHAASIYTSDLSHDYVTINAEYRT